MCLRAIAYVHACIQRTVGTRVRACVQLEYGGLATSLTATERGISESCGEGDYRKVVARYASHRIASTGAIS